MSNPTWLEHQEPLRKEGEIAAPSYGAELDGDLENRARLVFWASKLTTAALCVLMLVTSIIGFTELEGTNIGAVFICVYMMIFSSMLLVFEAIQVRHVESLDHMYRRNFGFLYDTKGKAFFIIFIAFLSFGLEAPKGLAVATGILFCCLGSIEIAMYLKYPELWSYKLVDENGQIEK